MPAATGASTTGLAVTGAGLTGPGEPPPLLPLVPPAGELGGSSLTSYLTVLDAALPQASSVFTLNENLPAEDVSIALPDATGPSHVVTSDRSPGSRQE
jgi:hypothetical protein